MLPVTKTTEWKGQDFRWLHFKYDGIALVCRKQGAECWTRRPTNLAEQISYAPFYELLKRLPPAVDVWGELYCPGKPASYVKSAIKKQEPLSFQAFAVPTLGEDAELSFVSRWCAGYGLDFAPYFQPPGCGMEEAFVQLRAAMPDIAPDLEGFVLKAGHLGPWWKWKPIRSATCVITGTRDGQGKHLGLIGSLEVSCYVNGILTPVAFAGGFDDETRADMTLMGDRLIGRICEVHYQYVGSKGRLRHPRFIRFRDDVALEACLLTLS